MKLNVKLLAPIAGLLAVGCGGTHSASITFPYVRVFNAVDGQNYIQVQFHDLNANLLSTSTSVAIGTANPTNDINFVYSEANATILSSTGNPLYAGSSVQYAQNNKYTVIAAGASPNYATIVLNDTQTTTATTSFAMRFIDASVIANGGNAVDVYVLPSGTTSVPGGATPALVNLKYAGVPSIANAAGVDANGYVTLPTNGATTFSVIFTATGTTTPVSPAQAITITPGAYNTDVLWDTGTTPQVGTTLLVDARAL